MRNSRRQSTKRTSGGSVVDIIGNASAIKELSKLPVFFPHLPKGPSVDIEFRHIYYNVYSCFLRKTIILNDVSGSFQSGQLSAIMGPSGCGKSTLMNVLSGAKTRNITGTIIVNKQIRNIVEFRKISCYIMQNDVLLMQLTVQEQMNFAAHLKLKRTNRKARKLIINEIIKSMGLTNVFKVKTNQLSGGQLKRLSIGLELLSNPPIMFLDEPTSGLDSLACYQCISILKALALGGRNIVCTIHQPSSRIFEIFDNLFVLTEGSVLYRGSIKEMLPFLNSNGLSCPSFYNPADFIIEVASGDYGEDYVEKLKNLMLTDRMIQLPSDANEPTMKRTTKRPKYNSGFCAQFYQILRRTIVSTLRDHTLTALRLVAHLGVGGIIGVIYYNIGNEADKTISNMGCLFFIPMFTLFASMMPTILTFPLELHVFMREYMNSYYSTLAYYCAKTLADIPFQIVFVSIYTSMVYWMSGQPNDWTRFMYVCNINIWNSMVSQSFGQIFGALFEVEHATFTAPVVCIPIIIFAGFFVNSSSLPNWLKILPRFNYLRYTFEAIMLSVYGEVNSKVRQTLHCPEGKVCPYDGDPKMFLKAWEMDKNNYRICLLAVVACFVITRIGIYFLLRVKMLTLR